MHELTLNSPDIDGFWKIFDYKYPTRSSPVHIFGMHDDLKQTIERTIQGRYYYSMGIVPKDALYPAISGSMDMDEDGKVVGIAYGKWRITTITVYFETMSDLLLFKLTYKK